MPTEPQPSNSPPDLPGGPTSGVRTVVSLLLFIHLFCVFVALCANYGPSGLEARFLRIMRVYTQALNLDLNQTPYQLTHGMPLDSDHLIEVLPQGASADDPAAWVVLPGPMFHGGERFKRYERLGELIDASREFSSDEQSKLAKAVAENVWHQADVKPKRVRCRQHMPIPLRVFLDDSTEKERDPLDASYYATVYDADILLDEQTGDAQPNKIEAAGNVARPTTTP